MAHIQVPEGTPGIFGPMAISPESIKALRELVEVLLHGPNTLTPAEREMIATYVVARARQEGATDKEIHDTVLIAAAFCMFNRYVDGLATWQPSDPEIYREIGMLTAQLGYAGRDYKKPLKAIAAKTDKADV
jgi:hypothetical protein